MTKITHRSTAIGLSSCYVEHRDNYVRFFRPGDAPIFLEDKGDNPLLTFDMNEMRQVRDFLTDTIERMEKDNA